MTRLINDHQVFDQQLKEPIENEDSITVIVPKPRNKGEMMKAVYTEKELRHIDSAIPMECWDKIDTAIHVMNYNDKRAFGKLENMEEIAKQRNIVWNE